MFQKPLMNPGLQRQFPSAKSFPSNEDRRSDKENESLIDEVKKMNMKLDKLLELVAQTNLKQEILESRFDKTLKELNFCA